MKKRFKIPLIKGDEILEYSYMPIEPNLSQPIIFDGDLKANPRLGFLQIENCSSIVVLYSLQDYAPPFQGGLLKAINL